MKLSLNSITKEFVSYDKAEGEQKSFRAVDELSLEVRDGELLTLLGPSGCGKTTLLRMLAGFEDPTAGDIYFGDERVNNLPPNKRNAAMVFQSYAIFPHLNVAENIVFGLKLKGMSKEKISQNLKRVIEIVELTGLEERQPSQLSGGQQQRVALARAIIMEPLLLLFDEPLSNLDAKLREQMRVDIRKLQKRLGITSVYVTHDQIEAMSISDTVVVMNRGKIEQKGSPRELYSKPANSFVASFIGKVNFVAAENGRTRVLRPEDLELCNEGADGAALAGRVARNTFLGSIIEYEIELDGGNAITIHTPTPRERVKAELGERVGLRYLSEEIHLL